MAMPAMAPNGYRRANLTSHRRWTRPPAATAGPRACATVRSPLAITDAWVEPDIQQLDEEVDHDIDGGHEQQQPLDHGVVAPRNGIHEQLPNAVQVEHLLSHHQSTDQEGELQTDHRHYRQHGVPQGMPDDDRPLGHTLRPGCARSEERR